MTLRKLVFQTTEMKLDPTQKGEVGQMTLTDSEEERTPRKRRGRCVEHGIKQRYKGLSTQVRHNPPIPTNVATYIDASPESTTSGGKHHNSRPKTKEGTHMSNNLSTSDATTRP
jgi:hypothetical protein